MISKGKIRSDARTEVIDSGILLNKSATNLEKDVNLGDWLLQYMLIHCASVHLLKASTGMQTSIDVIIFL